MVYTGEGSPSPPKKSQQVGSPMEQDPDSADPGHTDPADLTFPDLPRLELDALLGQMVERAQEVIVTQGRLRGLLRANQMVTGDLTLPVLLRRIVGAARDLVGARYAALGVIAADRHLAEFVHVGMPPDLIELIGQLPQGKGVLGALIDDPKPIRLRALGDDERSSGFPRGHPPMGTFLGVPIRVRNEVFGNLYLTESTKGEFTAEDEELATALAATAGVAIENSRLYEAARARHDWLRASAGITRQLLGTEFGGAEGVDGGTEPSTSIDALRLIAESCREIAKADLVTVVLPTSAANELRVEIAVGIPGTEDLTGTTLPLDGSLSGQVFTSGEPARMSFPEEQSNIVPVTGGLDVGPVLLMPLRGSRRIHGVLTAARLRGAVGFSAEDLDMAVGFANQASVAIELAEARAEQQRAAMLDERDRIAADLHDHVIQRLFATGLSLQSVAATLEPGKARTRVLSSITDLDDTISQIRTSIFQLRQVTRSEQSGVRARVLDVVSELTPALGFEPAVRFSGVFEDVLPDAVVEDLLAVLREALSNVARHARARSTTVTATTTPGRLTLQVNDDGAGIGPTTRRSGLANLARRAEHHGGTLTVAPNTPTGTQLTWTVPLS
jgi:signal transduction histidine kinase